MREKRTSSLSLFCVCVCVCVCVREREITPGGCLKDILDLENLLREFRKIFCKNYSNKN